MQAFSWICSLLRLYTRFFILHTPGWDDLFIILTMVRRPRNHRILAPLLTFTAVVDGHGLHNPLHMCVQPLAVGFTAVQQSSQGTDSLPSTELGFGKIRVYNDSSRS